MEVRYASRCPLCGTAFVGAHSCSSVIPKGERIPQTVESLQAIMSRDAEIIVEQAREISALKAKVNQLRQKLARRSDG